MHVASYRKIKPRRICSTVYKHSFSFSNHPWFHQRGIFIYTHQKVINYNNSALRTSSNYLSNPPAKKRKKTTTITTKTNAKEIKELLLIKSSCFSSRGRPNVLPILQQMAAACSWHVPSHVLGRRYCHGDLPECNLHVFGALSDVTGNEEEYKIEAKTSFLRPLRFMF